MPLRWLNGTGRNSKYRRSKLAEAETAGILGGRRVPGSGAIRRSAGQSETVGADLQVATYTANAVGAEALRLHAEHKRTAAPVLRVQREWFRKIHLSARNTAAPPAVVLRFETLEGPFREWVGLPVRAMAVEGPSYEVAKELVMPGASLGVGAAEVDSWGRSGKQGVAPAFTLTFTDADFPSRWVFVPIGMFRVAER